MNLEEATRLEKMIKDKWVESDIPQHEYHAFKIGYLHGRIDLLRELYADLADKEQGTRDVRAAFLPKIYG